MIIKQPDRQWIPALRQLWQQAFGDTDDFLDGFFRTGFSPDRCRCIIADNQPIAALYWFDCTWQGKKVAYIYAVATDLQCRGQGLCRALMENTHLHLKFQGYAGAVLVPGTAELVTMYEKLGYQTFCRAKSTIFCAQVPAIPAAPISALAFAEESRAYLPENAVIHGRETFDFLATFCNFYAGDAFLLCAAREEDTLHVQAYFGDPDNLPGIAAGLQAEKVHIRLPDNEAPFAMFHSLMERSDMPDFFTIALD